MTSATFIFVEDDEESELEESDDEDDLVEPELEEPDDEEPELEEPDEVAFVKMESGSASSIKYDSLVML